MTGAVASLPFASKLLPDSLSGYFFPPLGDIDIFARFAVIGFLFAATFVIYLQRSASHVYKSRLALILWVAAFVAFGSYFALAIRFVKVVPIPSLKDSVTISVGFERTAFAKQIGNEDDIELLRTRGPQEEEIQRLWTWRSLILTRLMLWAFYVAILSAFVGIFSLGALQHAQEHEVK